jgi:hypothetical protein
VPADSVVAKTKTRRHQENNKQQAQATLSFKFQNGAGGYYHLVPLRHAIYRIVMLIPSLIHISSPSFCHANFQSSLDNSEWMRNGDYFPSRMEAQIDAINVVMGWKFQSNPENTVGILKMGKGYVHAL